MRLRRSLVFGRLDVVVLACEVLYVVCPVLGGVRIGGLTWASFLDFGDAPALHYINSKTSVDGSL